MPFYSRLKQLLVGSPIHTKHAHHERLPKIYGLPVFASDALSSVAYATEEVLLVLVLMGAGGFYLLFNISAWLGVLLVIVGFSYYQTIHAYPKGGGTYLVSTENLGSMAGRIAAAALLIDYVLTVAVSIASASSFVVSAFPSAQPYTVLISCVAIGLLAIANLRGAKESGAIFAVPTYTFVATMIVLIIAGLIKATIGGVGAIPPDPRSFPEPLQAMTMYLLLRAFAASCTALTGTEAIADGVAAFRAPEARNASATLAMMVGLLLTMFLGLSWCAQHFGVTPMLADQHGYKTVVAQLAQKVFPSFPFFFYLTTTVTAVILFLAANTAFADFPRLSSFVARDGFLPRQLTSVGDRLVFQNGIVLLAALAMSLIFVYHANTHSLIPLYALGVFVSFTFSQAGMVARWFKRTEKAWLNYRMYISLVGSIATGIVSIILGYTKFHEGAWLILVAMALMLVMFWGIRRHYTYLAQELNLRPSDRVEKYSTTVLLLVPRVHRGILKAISYSQALSKDVRAIHVTLDPSAARAVRDQWAELGVDMPLVILDSPYRSLVEPVVEYVDQMNAEANDPNHIVTVIVAEPVPKYRYQRILHSNLALFLKVALGSRRNVVISNVRYFLE